MRKIIDQLISSKRFSMKALYESIWLMFVADKKIAHRLNILESKLGKKQYKQLACGILRHSFLIELVELPGIETTKFRTRWCSQLKGDQRECSFSECLEIAQDLVLSLTDDWLDNPENLEALNLFFDYAILPYELPIDYIERPITGDKATRIHRKDNVAWIVDENVMRTLKLRQYLTNPETSPNAKFFKKVIDDKIKVKTYLTDRVLTGIHKTNREKRWEAHPHSVHFALRRVCMAIEYELITQLCAFDGFPKRSKKMLQKQGILPQEMKTFRCPITLEPLIFNEFQKELMNPTHGKSNFHVGHLNPLKLDDPSSIISGHIPGNTSWISLDGNRIQGNLSLEEVRKLLKRIIKNYQDEGDI